VPYVISSYAVSDLQNF